MVESRIWRVGCGWVTKMVESKNGGEHDVESRMWNK